MGKLKPRTWTVDERIDAMEAKGIIKVPFTADERALARAASEALFFAFTLRELPARYPGDSDGGC
jgi:hypothetical protein